MINLQFPKVNIIINQHYLHIKNQSIHVNMALRPLTLLLTSKILLKLQIVSLTTLSRLLMGLEIHLLAESWPLLWEL